ncbi:MAG TPA: GEVED domain-containing protein [Kiritimatiellia bacterium]|nr:GEVED domain-containing protein [Kiritimatiellia bacterium]
MKSSTVLLFSACFLYSAVSAFGGPSLPVTKPPVADQSILTGPPVDPAATNGQWFLDYASGVEHYRTHEFHDNLFGGLMGVNAITGFVSSITYLAGPGSPITAFSIQATVWNDNTPVGEYMGGTNSHGESLLYIEAPYTDTLYNVKLTASFAVTDTTNLPSPSPIGPYPPYLEQQPYIEATNEDQAAWYCWSPESVESPTGGYFVPTWDFGDILPGQSSTRQLDFIVPATMSPIDFRYSVLVQSQATQADILLNRSTSLKISTWMDTIYFDTGAPYPEEPFRGSDVSVFHSIPEEEEEPEQDFGDAPDPNYPTLLVNDGARHIIVPGIQMGSAIDAEADGQQSPNADGDDNAGIADEDGVSFMGLNYAGQISTVAVSCSTSGWLYIWVDFDANGSWGDFGEHQNQWATQGLNYAQIAFPTNAAIGNTCARFRFTTDTNSLNNTGQARDGEVEDYLITIKKEEEEQLDFGDAMDNALMPVYPTLAANAGACHTIVPGVMLGTAVDGEPDGQPAPNADGDDNNPPPPGGIDDEDGVTLPSVFVAGASPVISVVASTGGFLDAWIDWNCDNDWADPGEQVFTSTPLSAGLNVLTLLVPQPPVLAAGGPHSRWRFTTNATASVSYTGWIDHGEVEDYEVRLEVLDFGDAPDPSYPTLLASDGARHRVPSVYYLGATAPDSDPDGLPAPSADGDDLSNLPDEDGVSLGSALFRGQTTMSTVSASIGGLLDAWMDFNADGDWSDAGENIAASHPLSAGANPFNITVPASAALGPTYARFRFSSGGGLSYTGLASDGEVEDYMFTIHQQSPDTNTFAVTSMVLSAGSVFTIQWAGESNVTYETQTLGDLLTTAAPPWTAWGPRITGGPYTLTFTNILETTRFFRVVAPFAQ